VHRLQWIFHPSLHLSPPLPVIVQTHKLSFSGCRYHIWSSSLLLYSEMMIRTSIFPLGKTKWRFVYYFCPLKLLQHMQHHFFALHLMLAVESLFLIYVEEYRLFICYSVLCQVIICPSDQDVTLPALIFNSKLHSEVIVCCSCYFMYQCWSNTCYPTIISFCGMIPSSTKDLTWFWFWYPDSCMMMNGCMFLTR